MSDMNDIWRKISKLGRYGGYGGLKSCVLYMLGERPMNGAELMDAMESMSYGAWRPSPGSIYPLLSKMVEERLITKREDGKYVLASEGYDRMNYFGEGYGSKPYTAASIMADFENYLSYLEDLPKDKVLPYEERLTLVIERMSRLKETLHK
jgi:DNA-binding PadR family transcriptional regulator